MNRAVFVAMTIAMFAVTIYGSAITHGQMMKQIADPQFDAKVDDPAYTDQHPEILFDEAHHSRQTTTGRFKPFVDLATNDGFHITPNKQAFSTSSLAGCDILVIVNAAVAEDQPKTKHAFTDEECNTVRDWIRGGGSLLLVADHAPCGSAAENLASRFGVDMRNGYTFDDQHCDRRAYWQLIFSRDNGLLADHPITKGRTKEEFIQRVMTFGGQSIKGPAKSTAFLKLADTAYDRTSFNGPDKKSAAGRAQAIALRFGKGRVVVLAEAAMLSAQVLWIRGAKPQSPMGMNVAGIDNRQLALNIMHWLSGILD